MLNIFQATTQEEISAAAAIFQHYADSLEFDLGFQNFTEELASLPGSYGLPKGRLLLAWLDGCLAGCVALRPLAEGVCEMKRLYVKPQFQGLGIGKALAQAIVAEGRKIGYVGMRLDTAPAMIKAKGIYMSLGFREIEPYCYNPLPGATFMELRL